MDSACTLYNQMDEEVHKLVILSNKSLHQLENLLELRTVQEETERVRPDITTLLYSFNLYRVYSSEK